MSFTDKLDALMAEKGINKSVLSKESGIPYTTIADRKSTRLNSSHPSSSRMPSSA